MLVTIFTRPHGEQDVVDISNVAEEDEKYFADNNVKVSMEDIGNDFAIYADVGLVDEDGEPDEVIIIADGRSCEETLRQLRWLCEERLKEN